MQIYSQGILHLCTSIFKPHKLLKMFYGIIVKDTNYFYDYSTKTKSAFH